MDTNIDDVAPVGRLDSYIINQDPLKPKLNEYSNMQNNILISMQKKVEEQGIEIKQLKIQNKQLKTQINETFQNIISIYNSLDKFNKLDTFLDKVNQFDLNFMYNRVDNQLYKLEDSYKSLNHDIIKSRGEFGLINSGIKKLLNSNIAKCYLRYKSSVDGKSPNVFHLKCDNLYYKLFLIKTTNEKRFGVFFSGKQKDEDKINLYNSYRNNDSNYNFFSSINSFDNFLSVNLSVDFNNNKNEIFNCGSYPDKFFVFSLNKNKIYFPRINNSSNNPCFSIEYEPNTENYYGKEKKININSQYKDYILSGKEKFNVLEFEVYEIETAKIEF